MFSRILVLDPATAIELVEAARAEGVGVLGLDGFLVGAETIQPLQEYTVDVEGHPDPHQAALAFLSTCEGDGLMFEVSLD